jgi:hypothetical protein
MRDVYQGCVYLVLRSGKERYLGQFRDVATYESLLSLAFDHCRMVAITVHGVVSGKEVSGEFTPRAAKRLAT